MTKFYLETYGCKLNQADSNIIKDILEKEGYRETSEKKADFVIINSCGVLEKTELKIFKRIKKLKKEGKKVILAGCLPLISFEKAKKLADGILGPKNLLSLPNLIKEISKGKKPIFLKDEEIDKIKYYPIKKEKLKVSIVIPISEGCLGNCSFCATKLARKRLKSFSKKEILAKIKKAIELEFKEIQLTSQDLAIYGLDKGRFLLPELLSEISKIEGDFKVRLGMMEPFFAKKILKEIFSILKSEKFYKFLHLPLQSGDNEVLRSMNRNYKVEDFLEIVEKFRENFKECVLATDIICGYPSETKRAFENSLKIIEKIKPEILHIFKFSQRKNTKAEKLKDFPDKIKKERTRLLTSLWKKINLEKNKKYIGKKLEVLVVEKREKNFLARANSFRAVILKRGKLGEKKRVKIIDAKVNYLMGA